MLELEKYTFIFVAINLLILYFLMKKILFKPITKFMDDRQSSIEHALDDAEKAKIEAADVRKEYEDQMKSIKSDCDKLMEDARVRASREYDEMISAAKRDVEVILQKGRNEIERERQEMMKQVKQQVAVLAIATASKLVQANMDSDTNKSLVDRFIDEAGA